MNTLSSKTQLQKSWEALQKAGNHLSKTAASLAKAIWETIKGSYYALDAGDIALSNKIANPKGNKLIEKTKRHLLKVLLATSIATGVGVHQLNKSSPQNTNTIEITAKSDGNTIDLKDSKHTIPTPAALQGGKVKDLYSHYLWYHGTSNAIGEHITFKPNEIMQELYSKKLSRKNEQWFRVARDFYENTVKNIDFDKVKPSSIAEVRREIHKLIDETRANFDRERFGTEKMKGNTQKLQLFKELTGKIDEKCLLAYGMTELMPSTDGKFNTAILDFLLKNGGEEFIMHLPAIADGYSSFGLYQFTSLAVRDLGTEKEGASKINPYLPKNLRIPWSVNMLKGKDHHRAAYLFAMQNIYTPIYKAGEDELKALNYLKNQKDNNSLAQLIAIMHNLPANGSKYLNERYKLNTDSDYRKQKSHDKTWKLIHDYDSNKNQKIDLFEAYNSWNSHQYWKKTHNNRNAL